MNRIKLNFRYSVFFLLLFTVCSLLFAVSFCGASAEEDVLKIQKAYEQIKDISGNFVQKSYIKDLKRTDTFNGQFFIKRPMKMKWSYKGDNAQEVLISNEEIIIYQKKEKQAFKGRFDRETYGQAPIALLNGFGKIQEEFTVSEKNGKLILKPQKPMGGVLSVEIEPSEGEFPIKSFTINDSLSNRIEMVLRDIKVNTGLEDKLFDLSLPKGISVFEHNP